MLVCVCVCVYNYKYTHTHTHTYTHFMWDLIVALKQVLTFAEFLFLAWNNDIRDNDTECRHNKENLMFREDNIILLGIISLIT